MGFTTFTSTMKTIAAIIMAASAAFGMKKNNGVRNINATMTRTPVYRFPRGVRTPLALFTAPRDNDPVLGKPDANEFNMFDVPIASSS